MPSAKTWSSGTTGDAASPRGAIASVVLSATLKR
jgi:hypothetical protein